jgi:tetratricopeptide (TPR) repeat protein
MLMKPAVTQRLTAVVRTTPAILGACLALFAGPDRAWAGQPAQPPLGTDAASQTADPLARARVLYNEGRYDEAIATAVEAAAAHPSAAHVIAGRAGLERFRRTADPADLSRARDALRAAEPAALTPRDRTDLIIGLGETLFFDEHYRSAADLFESTLDQPALDPAGRDLVLDWWATAIDRHVRTLPPEDRADGYDRLLERMERELRRDGGSASAAYWVAAGSLASGQIDRAWAAAVAGWVRALVTTANRGNVLRPDLDRLVRDAIIPERVRRLPVAGTPEGEQAHAGMLAEWEQIKEKWGRK